MSSVHLKEEEHPMKRILLSLTAGVLTLGGLALATTPASAQTIVNPPVVVQPVIVPQVIVQPQIIRPVIVRPRIVRRPVYRPYVVRRGRWWHRR
jgi:hypothetical protein